ncbi:MAG: amidophosphoribosyltransferase [Deferribacterota bacterium]|nr:amidophosphoribosyltransferase [Deferribacterota bacterium]
MQIDKFNEECAVVGVYGIEEAAKHVYLSLFALQHRGQEGSGIASLSGNDIIFEKGVGLVSSIFNEENLSSLKGNIAVGHNRYSTLGETHIKNVQPIVADINLGQVAMSHNGNLVNGQKLRDELVSKGAIFTSTSDSEVLIHLMAKNGFNKNLKNALIESTKQLLGAFSIVMIADNKLVGIRDPYGFRPLVLGSLKGGYVLASETVAFDLIDAKYIREIEPGEIVIISDDGIESIHPFERKEKRCCIFEYIYFARPDSYIFGNYVYNVRKAFGMKLAEDDITNGDIVLPVLDSGLISALGYSETSNIPIELGIIRNHYIGRTFIEPTSAIRHFGVKLKLNAVKSVISNKSVIVIDDSIVRGTTSRKIVKMLKQAGAREIHMRIASPPITHPCLYGIDTPSRSELIASTHTIKEIKTYLGVDSIKYLDIDKMFSCVDRKSFCDACFSGNYPILY